MVLPMFGVDLATRPPFFLVLTGKIALTLSARFHASPALSLTLGSVLLTCSHPVHSVYLSPTERTSCNGKTQATPTTLHRNTTHSPRGKVRSYFGVTSEHFGVTRSRIATSSASLLYVRSSHGHMPRSGTTNAGNRLVTESEKPQEQRDSME